MPDPTLSSIQLTAEAAGQRLDQFVAGAVSDLSRTEVQRLIKAGQVVVNGRPSKASYHLEQGDTVRVDIPPRQLHTIHPEDIPLDVLYEDGDLAAVNKPAGMVVHPAYGNLSGTLVNAALARWPEMQRVTGEDRAGIVHRLDKDTSGVIVLARTSAALKSLQAQFKARTVKKKYVALVDGHPPTDTGLIDAPIGRDKRLRKRMAVIPRGRPSQTRYDVLEKFEECCLLSLEPASGRTHQLRVHLAWLGHPVVADAVYGHRKQRTACPRLFLHAAELQVDSPSTGERLTFSAPLPAELEDVLAGLRAELGPWQRS
jgi:23S rRNA pseudouridine1911/1915/1917 synthase